MQRAVNDLDLDYKMRVMRSNDQRFGNFRRSESLMIVLYKTWGGAKATDSRRAIEFRILQVRRMSA
jgi:hypothetical protein